MMIVWAISAAVMIVLNLLALGFDMSWKIKLANAFVAFVLIFQLLAFFEGKAL